MVQYRFKKSEHLLKRQDFLILAEQGKVCHSRYFIGVFQQQNFFLSSGRIGITVSKKVGNAAVRNRIKRLVREYWRLNHCSEMLKLDINIIAKKNCANQNSREIFKSLAILLKKMGEQANG